MGLLSCPVDLFGVLVGPGSSEEEIHWLTFYSNFSFAQQFYCLRRERNGRMFQTLSADCRILHQMGGVAENIAISIAASKTIIFLLFLAPCLYGHIIEDIQALPWFLEGS